MAQITEQLLRKRSEHNECDISTLEELALHQEHITKIEHLQNWCKNLKILLLQSNLISKIENLNKLKQLEYLNLALNNIEVIENLEGCESLKKIDLTLNFIGELTSVENLKCNIHLESLFLTGNPCTDYVGYREYTIAVLQQLKKLDNIEILRSERIKAVQRYNFVKIDILKQQALYKDKRAKQKKDAEQKLNTTQDNVENDGNHNDIETNRKFWSEMSENTPEARIEIARRSRQEQRNEVNETKDEKRIIKRFNKDGKPLNVNEAKIPFHFVDDEENNQFVLELEIYKFLDTELLDVDVQPKYVTVLVKSKVFQMTLTEEVKVEQSSAQRSQTTGHLVITMPKANGEIKVKKKQPAMARNDQNVCNNYAGSKREFLEIGPPNKEMDFSNILNMKKKTICSDDNSQINPKLEQKIPSKDFVDDPTVPPLG